MTEVSETTSLRLAAFERYWHRVNHHRAAGLQVLDLGMGMPAPALLPFSRELERELLRAIESGDYLRYGPAAGSKEFITAVLELENSRLPVGVTPYSSANVSQTPGAIAAFALLSELLLPRNAIVSLVHPSYFTLWARCEQRFKPHALHLPDARLSNEHLTRLIPEKTRAVVLTQPNNPTGRYHSTEALEALIEWCEARKVWLIMDETCNCFPLRQPAALPVNIRSSSVLRVQSFSKSLNLSGVRAGYLLAAAGVVERFASAVPPMHGNSPLLADKAVVRLLASQPGNAPTACFAEQIAYFSRALRKLPEVAEVIEPEACYYVYARFGREWSSDKLCARLLDEQSLDVVPGSLFGEVEGECWLRFCIARPMATLCEAVERLTRMFQSAPPSLPKSSEPTKPKGK